MSMEQQSFYKITPRVIKVWQWSNSISYLFYFGIPIGYTAIFGLDQFHIWVALSLTLLVLVGWVLSIVWLPYKIWENWRYAINDKEIELKHGVFFKTQTLIPLSRVQHVDTRQGPLLRWYSLSQVTISTAATTHEIPGLDIVLANRVRRQISTYARLAEDDV